MLPLSSRRRPKLKTTHRDRDGKTLGQGALAGALRGRAFGIVASGGDFRVALSGDVIIGRAERLPASARQIHLEPGVTFVGLAECGARCPGVVRRQISVVMSSVT
jgi:hypothetical protein